MVSRAGAGGHFYLGSSDGPSRALACEGASGVPAGATGADMLWCPIDGQIFRCAIFAKPCLREISWRKRDAWMNEFSI